MTNTRSMPASTATDAMAAPRNPELVATGTCHAVDAVTERLPQVADEPAERADVVDRQ